jgi:AsmA protein
MQESMHAPDPGRNDIVDPSASPVHEPASQLQAEDGVDPSRSRRLRRHLLGMAMVLLALLLAFFLPPYINVSRYQRRIATNIGASLGRPVHFDRVTLTLLPLPGFTLENFVVEEDPAFGFEPILRADEVHATLRLSSIWGRRVEFSTISLTDPHVNLVRSAAGLWNLQSILRQTSHLDAAPTAQLRAGPEPRFPYIEATGARVNLKLADDKTPYSLTEADFALWLPQPRQWRLRVEAHTVRTDTAPSDTGTLRLEATLGDSQRAPGNAPAPAQIPIELHGNLQDAQLGGLSQLILGKDAGLRGNLNVTFSLRGTLDQADIATNFRLTKGRRADFVPPQMLSLEASCQARARNLFHAFTGIECHWPPSGSGPAILIATGEVPDTADPGRSTATATLPALPAATLLDWLRLATPHPPTGLLPAGTLAGAVTWNPSAAQAWSGELDFSGGQLQLDEQKPIPLGDVLLHSAAASGAAQTSGFDLAPVALALGGKQPATLEGHFDAGGYTLHLTGQATPARLLALADAVPQFGDGLRALLEPSAPGPGPPGRNAEGAAANIPVRIDLTATRPWGYPQLWRQTAPATGRARHR